MKTIIAILYAHLVKRKNKKWIDNPIKWQTNTFKKLIKNVPKTEFGKNHDFQNIKSYEQYKEKVPVRDYEELRPYIEKKLMVKKIFSGLVSHYILQKQAELLQVQNIFLLPKSL